MARTTYRYDMRGAKTPPIGRRAYANAAQFLARLKVYRDILTYQQWRTLRGQAMAGDIEGAERGLSAIYKRWQATGRVD